MCVHLSLTVTQYTVLYCAIYSVSWYTMVQCAHDRGEACGEYKAWAAFANIQHNIGDSYRSNVLDIADFSEADFRPTFRVSFARVLNS